MLGGRPTPSSARDPPCSGWARRLSIWCATRGCPRTCGTTIPRSAWPPSDMSCSTPRHLALDDTEVADLAQQHFSDYAQAVTLLHNVIPGAVIRFLQEDGLPVREDVLPEISRTIEETWHSQSAQAPRAARDFRGPEPLAPPSVPSAARPQPDAGSRTSRAGITLSGSKS